MIAGPVSRSLVHQLFAESPVVFEEVRVWGGAPELHPLEAAQVAGAIRRRQLEFAAGRRCARRALARLGIRGFALRNGDDRAPRWPAGVVGSITHTGVLEGQGYCAAVVARGDQMRTVGIDAEPAKPLPQALWRHVLTPFEVGALKEGDDANEAELRARAIFSAKECFYKAQFPLSRRLLQFHDVEIGFDWDRGLFEARTTAGAPADLPLDRCTGHLVRGVDFIVAAIGCPI